MSDRYPAGARQASTVKRRYWIGVAVQLALIVVLGVAVEKVHPTGWSEPVSDRAGVAPTEGKRFTAHFIASYCALQIGVESLCL